MTAEPLEHSRGSALEASGVSKTYATGAGPVQAVQDLSLRIDWGELVAVMGPSGSGKSTLLGLLAGLIDPDDGSPGVVVDGTPWSSLSAEQRARHRRNTCALIHQGINLVDFLTVAENVALPLLMDGFKRAPAMQRAAGALAQFGLADTGDRLPGQVSGGQQQRAAIARAAASSQRILLADEPTGALDSELATQVFEAMARHVDAGGVAIVVSHNDQVRDYAHRVLTIRDGVVAS